MSCEKYNNLIEKYLDGEITESELSGLRTHTETCQSCRDQLNRCYLLQDVVKDALSSRTPADEAAASVVAGLSADTHLRTRPYFVGARAAIAAGIVLAAGLLLGYIFGRGGIGETPTTSLSAQVPISVGELEGTVLVKHEGSEVWQALETGSAVHLGDTFHPAANSVCRLEFEDKSKLELYQNSMLVLKSYDGETRFYLEHGKLDAVLESPHPPFFISTPHGRVEALGTEFTVTVE